MLRRRIARFVAVPSIASIDDAAGLGRFTPDESSLLESTSDGLGFTTR